MIVITKTKKRLIFRYSLIVLIFNLNLQKQDISKIRYFIWGDELSFWTFDLSIWIIFILTFNKINQNTIYHRSMFILLILLILTFYRWNLIIFYFIFEISIIVVLSIIITWGYQPERVEAALFIIIMTILTSLPFIIRIINNTTSLSLWNIHCIEVNSWEYIRLILVFIIKIPTIFLHMWLPKVHVESPVQGSIILASILLKLGSYGLIRTTSINSGFNKNLEWIIISYSIWTALTIRIICFIQTDLKTIIAYSSVVHITLVFASITLNKVKSIIGSMYIIIGHGICSAGLFYIANIIYKNSKSRRIIVNKRIFSITPTAIMIWFFICIGNSPIPPSINIMGEFFSFKSIVNWSSNNITVILIIVIIFLRSLYRIFIFYIVTHRISKRSAAIIRNFNSKNINTSVILIIPITLTSIDPDLLII